MGISTVIFDLDGTLLYTLEDLTDSTNYALAQFGYPKRTVAEVRTFVGNGVALLIERAIPDGSNNPNCKECLEIFKKHYSENMYNKTKPYDGVMSMLKSLKNKNYKVAVVSNKFDSAVKELCNKYFADLVDVSVGQREHIAKKPAPDAVFEVINELNVKKEECIYVGDSEVDIQTANNAGMDCISVVWGYKDIDFLYSNGATILIYSPEEILDIV